jgi:8-oxo-dGTP pyrophosphatase MutT (NUDIX family)
VSLHSSAVSLLSSWTPPSAAQAELRDRYVAHLAAHADGCLRSCRPDHLTAGALVLSADRTAVLLTLHAKAGRWFQFGGHLEPGDASLAEGALREGREESGVPDLVLDPDPVHLDEHTVTFCGSAPAAHLDVRFVATAPAGAVPVVSEESADVRWFPVDALPDPDLGPLVAAALDRVAQSTS